MGESRHGNKIAPNKQLCRILSKLKPLEKYGIKEFLERLYNKYKSLRKVCRELRRINIKLRTKDLIILFEYLGIKRIPCSPHLAQARIKERKPFNGDKREKLYLWGFCKGDARIEASLTSIRIDVNGKLPTVLCIYEALKQYISKQEAVVVKNSRAYYAFSESIHKESFAFLFKEIDEIIQEVSDIEDLAALLAGLLDSEGSVYLDVRQRKYVYKGEVRVSFTLDHHIEITNCDEYLLTKVQELLKNFGIKATIPRSKTGFGCSRLRIYRREYLVRIIPIILKYLKHTEKKQKLEKLYEILSQLHHMNMRKKREFLKKLLETL